jgi:hypothetical protein
LPENVSLAVAVKITAACTFHDGPRIEADIGAADQAGAIHQTHRSLSAVVLPKNVGFAIVVEVVAVDDVPGRARL